MACIDAVKGYDPVINDKKVKSFECSHKTWSMHHARPLQEGWVEKARYRNGHAMGQGWRTSYMECK